MNGIYRAVYSVPGDKNEGIVFMDNGKIYGVDMTHTFHGTYTINGSNIVANVTRAQHASQGYNMDGGGNDLSITGTIDGKNLKGLGTIPGIPVKMDVTMQRIGDI